MFRRSSCHFYVSAEEMDAEREYVPAMTRLLEGKEGRVYLDTARPRVCIRGNEAEGSLHSHFSNSFRVVMFVGRFQSPSERDSLSDRRHEYTRVHILCLAIG